MVRGGRLYRLPDGFLMMAPTRMWPLAVTPILSPLGKLRAALEYFIPPRTDEADESMAAFVRRRLGREAFERLVEPLVGAVYAADMEKLSVEATLSRFRDMERQHGSLIRAMRHQRKHRETAPNESGARYSMFVTLRDGLSSLVDALAARLPAGTVSLNSPVERIERRDWRLASFDARVTGGRDGRFRRPDPGRSFARGCAVAAAGRGNTFPGTGPNRAFGHGDCLVRLRPPADRPPPGRNGGRRPGRGK